ncbi:MaoC/PaaZ C-terminal domain-containing protein [Ralstonia wenshanensis]|uniref:MaoC/PaaZ C-terminal domain-containing protein n=1 Tax=Ralstonia wenshanensis TaxID=2842456 RepID=UPI0021B2EE27|nr:MaoC/PaaZ C-terminal domain-containing protein [Ralstonia wenshanensis]MCT7307516.1 MaoC/PaaZ C-terminal domain-containing protein [Ralstonia wenshanensis]
MRSLALPSPMIATQTLVTEPPSAGALAWRALLSQRKGKRGGPLPRHTLVRQEVPLDAEHIAQYAAVCGFASAHGVPMTYPHLLGFPLQLMLMTESAFPYPVIGLVHLCNTIRQHERLRAGERVRVEVRPRRLFHHARGQAFAIETAIIRGSAVVWESLSTYLRVGVSSPQGAPLIALPNAQDLSPVCHWDVPADTGRRYAGVSGDWNPIHVSSIGAKLFGFAHPIAHGMWTKARALATLLPAAPLTQGEVVAEFKTPLSLPGEATLWQAPSATPGRAFEVRNAAGDKPYLRGMLTLPQAQQEHTGD